MKKVPILLAVFTMLLCACNIKPSVPDIIFDTDLGNDIDDAEALDLLYKYQDEGKINLLGICLNKKGWQTAAYVDVCNRFYGYPDTQMGVIRTDQQTGNDPATCYTGQVINLTDEEGNLLFETDSTAYSQLPDSWKLYRKLLSEAKDKSVSIVSVGFFNNLAALIESPADEYSKLDGKALIKKKVKQLCVMAGRFDKEKPEYNVMVDVPASQKIFSSWPTEINIFSWELGRKVKYPAESIENDFNWGVPHPLKEGYVRYRQMPYDNTMYDPTAVVFAAGDTHMYTVGEPGTVDVDSLGVTRFTPSEKGLARIMYLDDEQAASLVEYFKEYLTRKPKCMQ